MCKTKNISKVLRQIRENDRNIKKHPIMEDTIDFEVDDIISSVGIDKTEEIKCIENRCIECGFILPSEHRHRGYIITFKHCGIYKCVKKGGYYCKGKVKGEGPGDHICGKFVKDGEKCCCIF